MSSSNEELPKIKSSQKVPACPYKHKSCLNYDPKLKQGICQPHVNRHHKAIRCRWLPSWIPLAFIAIRVFITASSALGWIDLFCCFEFRLVSRWRSSSSWFRTQALGQSNFLLFDFGLFFILVFSIKMGQF